MNTSFDPLDLVNTYGAFGSVGKERFNVVFEGTNDAVPNDDADWKPYPYKGLPVALDERPPQIAPYHLRLDWQMWFAAMGGPNDYPLTLNLIWKLLHNDPGAVGLFRSNPFPDKPPRYIRAVLYRYSFVRPNPQGLWWKREKLGLWLPPLDDEPESKSSPASGWLQRARSCAADASLGGAGAGPIRPRDADPSFAERSGDSPRAFAAALLLLLLLISSSAGFCVSSRHFLELLFAHRFGHALGRAFERRLLFFAAFRSERCARRHLLLFRFRWHIYLTRLSLRLVFSEIRVYNY